MTPSGRGHRSHVAARTGGILAVLAALGSLAPLSMDIYAPSILDMQAELRTTDWLMQATITGCLLGIAIGQILWGPLTDRYGRRPIILIGVIGWTAAAAASAIATSVETLVLVRVLAGFLGAACIVASRSVIRDITPELSLRAARIGLLSLVSSGAPIIAPIAGAGIAALWGWRADFFSLAIIGLGLSIVFALLVPETNSSPDHAGGRHGVISGLTAALRDRELVGITLALACFALGFYAYIATSAFIVQRERGYPPVVYAIVFGTNAAAMVCATLLYRRLVHRRAARSLMGSGLIGAAAAGALLALAAALNAPDGLLWLASILFTGSAGMVLPAAHAAGQSLLVASGAASALTGGAQFLGGVIGSPLTGAIGTTTFILGTILAASSAGAWLCWRLLHRRSPRDSKPRWARTSERRVEPTSDTIRLDHNSDERGGIT